MSLRHIASGENPATLSHVDADQIQPNAVDLRVDKIYRILASPFTLTKDNKKTMRRVSEVKPNKSGMFKLRPGAYEILMEGEVSIPQGHAGWVITRSTLIRNGLFITSGLYDSGYTGVMAGCLHVTTQFASIEQGARVGQFILADAETLHLYEGSYGVGSEHDKKYEDSDGTESND